jgi:hypothetical protein
VPRDKAASSLLNFLYNRGQFYNGAHRKLGLGRRFYTLCLVALLTNLSIPMVPFVCPLFTIKSKMKEIIALSDSHSNGKTLCSLLKEFKYSWACIFFFLIGGFLFSIFGCDSKVSFFGCLNYYQTETQVIGKVKLNFTN